MLRKFIPSLLCCIQIGLCQLIVPTQDELLDTFVAYLDQVINVEYLQAYQALADSFFQDLIELPQKGPVSEFANMPIQQRIRSLHLDLEEHTITTEDGYILTLWHIIKIGQDSTGKPPVLFQHGIIDHGGVFFFNNETDQSLILQVLEDGNDVWIANGRGTCVSYQHTEWTDADPEYWNYTFHELGMYDTPANVDYILDYTGFESLTYFGHSQGSTQFFVAMSMLDDFPSKIDTFIGLGPVMYLEHTNDLQFRMWNNTLFEKALYQNFDHVLYAREGASVRMDRINHFMPKLIHYLPRTSLTLLGFSLGSDRAPKVDLGLMQNIAHGDIGGTSVLNIKHWKQTQMSGNFETYGDHPQNYPLYKFKDVFKDIKSMIVYGENDPFCGEIDINRQIKLMPDNLEILYLDDYSHLDVVWAEDASQKVFKPILEFMNRD